LVDSFRLTTSPLWRAAKQGTVREFVKFITEDKDVLTARGPSYNETLLHIACLFSNTDVALYLIENYPELINQPYGGIYQGLLSLCLSLILKSFLPVPFPFPFPFPFPTLKRLQSKPIRRNGPPYCHCPRKCEISQKASGP